jgi:endogenous inhibitor of DNA gyrase (YacG/DUF329 family)
MSAVTCDWCGGYVESSNHRHTGFCSADCSNAKRLEGQALEAERSPKEQKPDATNMAPFGDQ